jgi:hypothetical protein
LMPNNLKVIRNKIKDSQNHRMSPMSE